MGLRSRARSLRADLEKVLRQRNGFTVEAWARRHDLPPENPLLAWCARGVEAPLKRASEEMSPAEYLRAMVLMLTTTSDETAAGH